MEPAPYAVIDEQFLETPFYGSRQMTRWLRRQGVVQRCQHFRFPLKPGEAIRIVRERLRQDLQRHVPVELRVSRSIHLAL